MTVLPIPPMVIRWSELGSYTDTDGDGRPNDCDSACVALGMAADPDDDNDGILPIPPMVILWWQSAVTLTLMMMAARMTANSLCLTSGMAADPDDDKTVMG